MPTKHEFENDISKIKVPQGVTLDEQTLKAIQEHMKQNSGCVNKGALELCYTVNSILPPKVTITISAFGYTIGTIVLDPENPSQTLTVNFCDIVTGWVKLFISDTCVKLDGKLCKFGSCTTWNNVSIVCWG